MLRNTTNEGEMLESHAQINNNNQKRKGEGCYMFAQKIGSPKDIKPVIQTIRQNILRHQNPKLPNQDCSIVFKHKLHSIACRTRLEGKRMGPLITAEVTFRNPKRSPLQFLIKLANGHAVLVGEPVGTPSFSLDKILMKILAKLQNADLVDNLIRLTPQQNIKTKDAPYLKRLFA